REDRLLVDRVVRRGEVTEVERVAEDAAQPGLLATLAELLERRGSMVRRSPRARALREDLQRLGADRLRPVDGRVDAARRRKMRADVHQANHACRRSASAVTSAFCVRVVGPTYSTVTRRSRSYDHVAAT